ncbi:MAG: hypothetical protein M3R72_12245 [Bacteroidota bacterium]|nr:hypothetical protein [Bacteroidota bacterium]
MFDEILNLVKEHMGSNPQVANAIPADQQEDVQKEVATHINNGLQQGATTQGGIGGLLSQLSGSLQSGSPITSAIEGGLVGSLGIKFGLPAAATGAIAAALPGLLQKFAHKANDPNDNSITMDGLTKSFGGGNSGGLGSMFGFGK